MWMRVRAAQCLLWQGLVACREKTAQPRLYGFLLFLVAVSLTRSDVARQLCRDLDGLANHKP